MPANLDSSLAHGDGQHFRVDRYQRTPTAGSSPSAPARPDTPAPIRRRAWRPTQRGAPA